VRSLPSAIFIRNSLYIKEIRRIRWLAAAHGSPLYFEPPTLDRLSLERKFAGAVLTLRQQHTARRLRILTLAAWQAVRRGYLLRPNLCCRYILCNPQIFTTGNLRRQSVGDGRGLRSHRDAEPSAAAVGHFEWRQL